MNQQNLRVGDAVPQASSWSHCDGSGGGSGGGTSDGGSSGGGCGAATTAVVEIDACLTWTIENVLRVVAYNIKDSYTKP